MQVVGTHYAVGLLIRIPRPHHYKPSIGLFPFQSAVGFQEIAEPFPLFQSTDEQDIQFTVLIFGQWRGIAREVMEVYAVGYDLVFARERVIYIPPGCWRDSYASVEASLPTLDDWVGKTIEMLACVGGVEGPHVNGLGEFKDAQRKDRCHGFMQVDDVELLLFQ